MPPIPSLDPKLLALWALATLGGVLLAKGQQVFSFVRTKVRERFTASIEVRDPDLFRDVSRYVESLDYGQRCRTFNAIYDETLENVGHGTGPVSTHDLSQREAAPRIRFFPGVGSHVFRHEGSLVWLTREREDRKEGTYSFERETYRVNTFGRSTAPARRFLDAAAEHAHRERAGKVPVYRFAYGWSREGDLAPRSLESVVLAAGQMETLVDDVERFLARRPWYTEHGIPWRRGYLFEGPPGTGKSSLAAALAARFRLPIYVLSLTSLASDETLASAIADVRTPSVLLLEDVDAAQSARERTGDEADAKAEARGITTSGLLNALDGVDAKEGRILVMTTNHADRLDGALVRDGRVDVRLHVGLLDEEQARRLWCRFFPEESYAQEAAEAATGLAPATVQGCVLRALDAADPEHEARALLVAEASRRLFSSLRSAA